MKKSTFFTLAAAALLAGTPAAKAVTDDGHFSVPDLVNTGDTYSFDVSGFNSAGTTGYLLTPDETATFGATTTYTAVGINGQNITITSSESIGLTTTTDTFTVSTPTSFLTTAKVNGTTIAAVQFDIGNANSGSNTVDYTLPITSPYSLSAYVLYGTAETQYSYTPANTAATLTNGGDSLAIGEGINFGTAISTVSPNTLSVSITYPTLSLPNVPEPSTYAAAAVGALALGTVLLRRNRRSAGL